MGSFGTWYYPPTPHQTSLLLKTLTTLSIPYIFLPGVAPSQSRSIVLETISSNHQTAYTADWLPQTEILHHPAISAFLTHAGSNSVVESIGFGVPMVFWPGGIDQPIIANELSERGVGIELIQIRRGESFRLFQNPRPLRKW